MRRLLFTLICLSLVSLSQATIIKCQAEDSAVISAPGNNWSTIYDEAAGSEVLDVTVQGFTTPPSETSIRYFKFKAPAGTYSLYIRYTKANDGSPAYLNDSFFCSDSSFAQDAVMATRNNTPATGVEDLSCEGGNYAWVNIDNNYVQAEDGAAYFKLAPREDGWRCDAFAFVTSDETLTDELLNNAPEYNPYAPYDPVYSPQDADGSVGTPVQNGGGWQVEDVVLGFTSGPDPAVIDTVVPDPDVARHNIFLQTGAPDDPNLYPVGSIDELSEVDPDQSFGPLSDYSVALPANTTVQWQVEQVMRDSEGVPYGDGDPNNVMGPVWSFLTSDPAPKIVSISDHMLTDSNGDTSFTIAASLLADHYQWFEVVGDVDSEGGESDDIKLADSGIYSGTTTITLVITGAASDGSDDARVYAIAYNGDPEVEGSAASEPSAARWFWYPRLVNHYPFESISVVDGNDVTPDVVSGYDMIMMSNDTGDDVPTQESNVPSADGIAGNTYSLNLNNPRAVPADPNNGDTQYAEVGEGWAASYKDVTISVWVYSKGSSNWNRIFDYGNGTDDNMFLCVNVNGDDNDAVRFEVKAGGVAQNVTTGNNALPDNEWTLVTATLSGDTARIFINGEWVVTNDALTNDPVSYGPTTQNWIGRSQYGDSDGYFNGLIDELKIFNYGLTNEEAGQLYLADTLGEYLCDTEGYDIGVYDTDDNCILNLLDFATLAARWMEDDRIHNEP